LEVHRVSDDHEEGGVAESAFHFDADHNAQQGYQFAGEENADVEPSDGALVRDELDSGVVEQAHAHVDKLGAHLIGLDDVAPL